MNDSTILQYFAQISLPNFLGKLRHEWIKVGNLSINAALKEIRLEQKQQNISRVQQRQVFNAMDMSPIGLNGEMMLSKPIEKEL